MSAPAAIDLPPWLEPTLARALALPAHALLLHASGAYGQFELAMALAAAWLCEAPRPDGQACGQCAGCRLLAVRSHPDFRGLVPDALRERVGWVDEAEEGEDARAGKAKASREIRVDAVRAAIDWGQRSSSRGRAKVILIHPAEAMNAVTANALLKTLEEPPGALRLVLTAQDPEALLPTVRSRCQRVQLDAPSTEVATSWLAARGIEAPAVMLAAAGGQPQAALALATDGVDAAAWQQFPVWAQRGQAGPVLGWPVARVVEALSKLAHDLVACRGGGGPRYFDAMVLAPLLKDGPGMPALVAWSRALLQAARHDEHPWHAALRFEARLAQAAALWQTPREPRARPQGALDTLARR
jgi:DNA polymerase-3 subunit delta'